VCASYLYCLAPPTFTRTSTTVRVRPSFPHSTQRVRKVCVCLLSSRKYEHQYVCTPHLHSTQRVRKVCVCLLSSHKHERQCVSPPHFHTNINIRTCVAYSCVQTKNHDTNSDIGTCVACSCVQTKNHEHVCTPLLTFKQHQFVHIAPQPHTNNNISVCPSSLHKHRHQHMCWQYPSASYKQEKSVCVCACACVWVNLSFTQTASSVRATPTFKQMLSVYIDVSARAYLQLHTNKSPNMSAPLTSP